MNLAKYQILVGKFGGGGGVAGGGGLEDQYASTYGGITAFTFKKDGSVTVEPLKMREEEIEELNMNTMLFYTGVQRSASEILNEQVKSTKKES